MTYDQPALIPIADVQPDLPRCWRCDTDGHWCPTCGHPIGHCDYLCTDCDLTNTNAKDK